MYRRKRVLSTIREGVSPNDPGALTPTRRDAATNRNGSWRASVDTTSLQSLMLGRAPSLQSRSQEALPPEASPLGGRFWTTFI